MASALLEELKTVATEVKRSQIRDAVGSSWEIIPFVKKKKCWFNVGLIVVAGFSNTTHKI